MKPLSQISQKIDQFIRSLERSRRKADFVENLRRDGWIGDDEQIISDYNWILLPKGGKEVPKEPEQADDVEEVENE